MIIIIIRRLTSAGEVLVQSTKLYCLLFDLIEDDTASSADFGRPKWFH